MSSRPSPEQLLLQAEEEAQQESRGRLKIFLGYSSRVGKSYRMFDEGRRRAVRGQDVVVGAVQPHSSPEVEALLGQLEVIPLLAASAMDLKRILQRHPQLCLIDGLAYQNPPGAAYPERWQGTECLLQAGISVVASINLQYVAESQQEVAAITGRVPGPPSVPLRFIQTADEIEIVDAPPPAAGAENVAQLAALREVALLLAADVVDKQLERYLRAHGIEASWGTQERILICLGEAAAAEMIASARRNADRFHAEMIAVPFGGSGPELDANVEAARAAGAQIYGLDDPDPVAGVVKLAREHGITQIFVGHSRRPTRWWQPAHWSSQPLLERLIDVAEGADVRIFPLEASHEHDPA